VIVVGVDFSPESECAVAHAMAAARRTGSPLTLVHVGLVPDDPIGIPTSMRPGAEHWRSLLLDQLAEDRRKLGELRERLAGQGVEISQVVVDNFPDVGVAAAAHELGAVLLVVGTHGRSGVRRFLLGSVAEKTIRVAEASVLVARGDANPGGYRRVVAGTDFSPHARRAIEWAFALAAPDAEIRVVHTWESYAMSLSAAMRAELHAGAEEAMATQRAEVLESAHGREQQVSFEVVEGCPAVVLDDRSERADLVVVGSHGRRGLRRFFLGSVAEQTVRHGRCSVLVAR
jgi:nucleotide-binding universal stress UspA family protein